MLKEFIYFCILYYTGILNYLGYEVFISISFVQKLIYLLYLIDVETIVKSLGIPEIVLPKLPLQMFKNAKEMTKSFKFTFNSSIPILCFVVYIISRFLANSKGISIPILLVLLVVLFRFYTPRYRIFLKFLLYRTIVLFKFIDIGIFSTFFEWNRNQESINKIHQKYRLVKGENDQKIFRFLGLLFICTVLDMYILRPTGLISWIIVNTISIYLLLDNSTARVWCLLRILVFSKFHLIFPLSVVLLLNGKHSVACSILFYTILNILAQSPILFLVALFFMHFICSISPFYEVTTFGLDHTSFLGLLPQQIPDQFEMKGYYIMDPITPKKLILTNDNVFIEFPRDDFATFDIEYNFDDLAVSFTCNKFHHFNVSTNPVTPNPMEFNRIRFTFVKEYQSNTKRIITFKNCDPNNNPDREKAIYTIRNIQISHEQLEQFCKMIRSSHLRHNMYNHNPTFEIFLSIIFQCFGFPTYTHLIGKPKNLANRQVENLILTSDVLSTLQLCWDEVFFKLPDVLSCKDVPQYFNFNSLINILS